MDEAKTAGFSCKSRLKSIYGACLQISPVQLYIVGGAEALSMEGLGKEMVDHCGGLPLAVVVLGGILASKSSYEEWKLVHKYVTSCSRKGKIIRKEERHIFERDDPLYRILALSYNDLPNQLKPYFLYLSIYSEDEEIDTDTLYHIWMAEGLVLNKHKMANEETIMDVAERYLGELAEWCMFLLRRRRFRSCLFAQSHERSMPLKSRRGELPQVCNFSRIETLDLRCIDPHRKKK